MILASKPTKISKEQIKDIILDCLKGSSYLVNRCDELIAMYSLHENKPSKEIEALQYVKKNYLNEDLIEFVSDKINQEVSLQNDGYFLSQIQTLDYDDAIELEAFIKTFIDWYFISNAKTFYSEKKVVKSISFGLYAEMIRKSLKATKNTNR